MNLKPHSQDRAWSQLLAQAEHLPQGLLLLGPSGVGKRRSVKALYQWIHCAARTESSPCGVCVSCRKISEGKHVDLIEIGPKGDSIPVDDLREMQKSLYFAPMDGKMRFIILDDAHKLNAASANTILKTLEEPPVHTRFFLITHERALLLPTILSRCQFMYFSPLGTEALRRILIEQNLTLSPRLEKLCLELLGGGMSRANLLCNEQTQEFLEETVALLSSGRTDILKLADQLAVAETDRLELFLDLLVLRGRQEALVSNTRAKADLALKATYLRRRLERHANKKLIALATATLAARTQSA